MTHIKFKPAFVGFFASALLLACSSAPPAGAPAVSTTLTAEQQSALTPDTAQEKLKQGNQRFLAGTAINRDYPAQVRASADGQHPFAVVLACADSRTSPEIIFDQGIGDI